MKPDFSTLKPVQPDFNSLKPVSYIPEQKPNYFQRVGTDFGKAGEDVVQSILEKPQYPGQNVIRGVGAIAGAAFSPIFEAPGIKQATDFISKKIVENPTVQPIIKEATDLAIKYPNVAKDLGAIVNVLSLGIGGAGVKEGKAIGSDIIQGSKSLLTPSEETVQKNIVSLFSKSIKPTAKKTASLSERYDSNVVNALKTIKANADQLNLEDATGELVSRTPQTINELSQSLEQTKKLVFSQYDTIAKNANKVGVEIDAKPIANEVLKVAENKALQLTNPEVVKYAEKWAERLNSMGNLDTETTQEVIKLMNNNLSAFYKNPTYDTASKVAIDAGIANNFRASLDKAIESATGEQYQVLKNQYASLKAIENDVVRASMREGRKNIKGLLDYSDIFTSGQMLSGILSLNPAMFTKGAIERGIKEYIKFLNNPNRAVGKMFELLDSSTVKPFTPTSATFGYLQNPKIGMSIEDVTKGSNAGNQSLKGLKNQQMLKGKSFTDTNTISKNLQPLAEEARKYKTAEEFVKAKTNAYHGSYTKVDKFEKGYFGDTTANNEAEVFYFTQSPKHATEYSREAFARRFEGEYYDKFPKMSGEDLMKKLYEDAGANLQINPSFVDIKKPKVINWKGESLAGKWEDSYNMIREAKAKGYDGVIFKNISDDVNPESLSPQNVVIAFEPDQIKTKSQLTDIWKQANKAVSKVDDTLLAEARKYPSAEKFVKAQGKPLYHGTTKASIVEKEGFKKMPAVSGIPAWGEGTYLTTYRGGAKNYGQIVEGYLPKDLKLKTVFDKDAYTINTKKLIEEGYDGVRLNYGSGENITIFDPSIIKTKSQLIEIWKKANKKK